MGKIENPVVGSRNVESAPMKRFVVDNAEGWETPSAEQLEAEERAFYEAQERSRALSQAGAQNPSRGPFNGQGGRVFGTPPEGHYTQNYQRGQVPEPQSQYVEQKITAADVEQMRREKKIRLNTVDEATRKNIELIVGIGRSQKEVAITNEDGETRIYLMRTLKGNETKAVIIYCANQKLTVPDTGESAPMTVMSNWIATREATLAYAIRSIDGIDLDMLLGTYGATKEEQYAARLALVDELDEGVLGELYKEHLEMTKKSGRGALTEDKMKEVHKDLSKSGKGAVT